jgi:hypothetical protein
MRPFCITQLDRIGSWQGRQTKMKARREERRIVAEWKMAKRTVLLFSSLYCCGSVVGFQCRSIRVLGGKFRSSAECQERFAAAPPPPGRNDEESDQEAASSFGSGLPWSEFNPIQELADMMRSMDDVIDDFMNKRMGNGEVFYGKRKYKPSGKENTDGTYNGMGMTDKARIEAARQAKESAAQRGRL